MNLFEIYAIYHLVVGAVITIFAGAYAKAKKEKREMDNGESYFYVMVSFMVGPILLPFAILNEIGERLYNEGWLYNDKREKQG